MPELSQSIAELSPKKRALLDLLLKKNGLQPSRPPTTRHRRESEGFPLSFAQARLWFIDQLAPGSPFNARTLAVSLRGTLDLQTLERTLTEVVRRHESLRTAFD
jgi:hypothetical protein